MADTVIIVIAAMAFAIGLFSALQLALRHSWASSPTLPLAIFLILCALSAGGTILGPMGTYTQMPWLIGLIWVTSLFYGPAILAYVRAMTTTPDQVWTLKRVGMLSAPAILAALLASVFFILPAQTQLGIYNGQSQGAVAWLELGFIALFLIVTLGYLGEAFRALSRHMRHVREVFSNIEDRTLNWLRWLLIVMLLAWAWGMIKSAIGFNADQAAGLDIAGGVMELVWIGAVGLFGTWQRPIFTGETAIESEAGVAEKYARSSLPDERQHEIAQKLDRIMRAETLYRDPLLSLSTLARRLGVSANHLSQTLNDHLGVSFFDYINRLRVEEALTEIRESEASLLTIAYGVGFNSRSTFNAAVKKHTGKAPSAFRQ
ncbi:helix-turn-helix domain-containing protein [Woodsholea maritima]|uniref:helix-turn-helix domain-containing protein n=1 Tax=Woodsholea maritima TaxID=240237 RepID=UPI000366AF38|nr:AraC family transcriptional regulator [Woodsholea maritima]